MDMCPGVLIRVGVFVLMGLLFSIPPTWAFQWTSLPGSPDTRRVYLSSSTGDDNNDCLSEATACATLMRGESLLRDGFPDHLLLKKGDTWYESFSDGWSFSWSKSGRGPGEPMVIGSYGSGPRPRIAAGDEHGFHRYSNNDIHDLAVVDLHFEAHTRNPYAPYYVSPAARDFQSGWRWTGGGTVERILIEGCKFEFFRSNFAMHPSGTAGPFRDVSIRGNVFYSAWSGSKNIYSQGVYADDIDGLLIEGNVFDRNGGLLGFTNDPNAIIPPDVTPLDAAVTWFNHQAYIQSNNRNVVVRNNIFANGDCVQLRPGGTAEDNLFTRCINALTVGPATVPVAGGVSGRVANNVFVEGTDFAPESDTPGVRANGVIIANIDPAVGLSVEDNLFAADMSEGHYGRAISASGQMCGSGNAYPCTVHNVSINDNIVYDWRGGFRMSGNLGTEIGDITFSDNLLQNPSDDQANLLNLPAWDAAQFTFSGTQYHRAGNANWIRVDSTYYDVAGWISVSSEPGAAAAVVPFPDTTRGVAAYHSSLGGAGTHLAFMQRARQQSRDNWNANYEAVAINAFIRAGFSLDVDGDGDPNVTDPDDDDDGMTDVFEIDNSLDPLNPLDAGVDLDGDGLTNLEEFELDPLLDPHDPDSDGDGIDDALDDDPLISNNDCVGADAVFAALVTTDVTCAAQSSIAVEPPAEVQHPGHLRLISPIISVKPGFRADRLSVISSQPCTACSP